MENKELKTVIKNIRDGFNKTIRDNNCKDNNFMKNIYEKLDKLREQEDKENTKKTE